MAEQDRARVRIACAVDGHADDWIEFDTSLWTLADYELLMGRFDLSDGLRYVKRDSVAWHVCGSNGVVAHPGRGADSVKWLLAWKAIGPEGLRLSYWLATSPGKALLEAVRISRKSAGDVVEVDDEAESGADA